MKKHTLVVLVVVTFSALIVLTLTIMTVYYATLPGPEKDSSHPIKDRSEYLKKIYHTSTGPPLDSLIKDSNLDWLWDTTPTCMLDKVPMAENLSFVWPPPKGSRYRLTAFPYPDTGNSSWWMIRFIKGMRSLLDNTSGQVTFPGWQVSIYDPVEPNYNNWQSFLQEGITDQKLDLEVTHACYAPPKKTYPTCDDGGYWLYGTIGSGVFWTTNGTPKNKTGSYLVCNNKIDAIFKLWNYASTNKNPGGKEALKTLKSIAGFSQTKIVKVEDYLYARLKGTGGGKNLMSALKTVIEAMNSGHQIPSITAWRSMAPSNATKGWATWISLSLIFILILMVLCGAIFYSIYRGIRNRKTRRWWVSVLITTGLLGGTLLTAYILYILEWNVVCEYMFEQFGYTTLDMALQKSKLDLKDFIFASAGLDKEYKKLPKGKYNPIANGLAQTQLFDFDLSYLTSMCGLDSVVMHAQPNKSGSWAVEILDVRNTPAQHATKLSQLIKTLGLCGQPIDKDTPPLMPPLKQGPLETSDHYVGYQPTANCNCNEAAVRAQYRDGKGPLKKCVFCKGSLSETLC